MSSGQPAISLPLHWTPDGLPVAAQLVAAAGREDLLLRVASQLEVACPWVGRWGDALQSAPEPPAPKGIAGLGSLSLRAPEAARKGVTPHKTRCSGTTYDISCVYVY